MNVDSNYSLAVADLKQKIRSAKQRIVLMANAELLKIYYEIGTVLSAQYVSSGWGAKIFDKLSADLKREFPDIKGFSVRNLNI